MSDSCRTCRFWESGPKKNGLCRRRSPAVLAIPEAPTYFPETLDDDWCGEYEQTPGAETPMLAGSSFVCVPTNGVRVWHVESCGDSDGCVTVAKCGYRAVSQACERTNQPLPKHGLTLCENCFARSPEPAGGTADVDAGEAEAT